MLCCGLATAVSSLIFKVFAIEVAFWTTTFWMFVGEAIFGVSLLASVATGGRSSSCSAPTPPRWPP
jgi:hypothetical protein